VLQCDVLLEHVPAGIAVGAELGEDLGDARVTVAERTEETLLHRRSVGDAPLAYGVAKRAVRVLQVDMPDTPSGGASDRDRVTAAGARSSAAGAWSVSACCETDARSA